MKELWNLWLYFGKKIGFGNNVSQTEGQFFITFLTTKRNLPLFMKFRNLYPCMQNDTLVRDSLGIKKFHNLEDTRFIRNCSASQFGRWSYQVINWILKCSVNFAPLQHSLSTWTIVPTQLLLTYQQKANIHQLHLHNMYPYLIGISRISLKDMTLC